MFSRLLLTIVGLACASAAALLFLPFAVLVDPLVQSTASHVPADHWFEFSRACSPMTIPRKR